MQLKDCKKSDVIEVYSHHFLVMKDGGEAGEIVGGVKFNVLNLKIGISGYINPSTEVKVVSSFRKLLIDIISGK